MIKQEYKKTGRPEMITLERNSKFNTWYGKRKGEITLYLHSEKYLPALTHILSLLPDLVHIYE